MERSRLNGNKNGIGLYELMTAPEEVYRKAPEAAEINDLEEFCELLGIHNTRKEEKNDNQRARL